jgi:hypothetical protein
MDAKKMIIATSGETIPFYQNLTRVSALQSNESWISKTAEVITPNERRFESIVVDGVPYFISVSGYLHDPKLGWTIVLLTPKSGFLALQANYRKWVLSI